jgi:hypothetical protein
MTHIECSCTAASPKLNVCAKCTGTGTAEGPCSGSKHVQVPSTVGCPTPRQNKRKRSICTKKGRALLDPATCCTRGKGAAAGLQASTQGWRAPAMQTQAQATMFWRPPTSSRDAAS